MVGDSVQLASGLNLANLYMSFGASPVSMMRVTSMTSGNVSYQASTTLNIYMSADAHGGGASAITSEPFTFTLDPAPVYSICYDNLTSLYSNVQNISD